MMKAKELLCSYYNNVSCKNNDEYNDKYYSESRNDHNKEIKIRVPIEN